MKHLSYIFIFLVMALTACHDDDYSRKNGDDEGQQTFINFATRAGGEWDDVLLPGQKYRSVVVDGITMLVPQSIGIYGFLMNDNYSKVLDADKADFAPVFNNDVLKEYDRTEAGTNDEPNELEPDVLEEVMEEFKEEQWKILETEEFGAIVDEATGARENLLPVDEGTNIDGSITQPNGEVTDSTGNVIIQGSEDNPVNPDNPDNPDNQTSGEQIAGGDGTQTNPARPRLATRTDIPTYDDDFDRYYWGYNAHRWTSGHYMFYAYSPASEHVDLDYNKDGADAERELGKIGKFTWGKIPSISNTDYIVAKNEVWKYNDPTRVHFDAMDHLMSRIRVALAVHPDFHKIRRVVVTKVSLTILEPGFNRIYEYSNQRAATANKVDGISTGINRVGDAWTVWKENGKDYLYNPAKNPATYAENVQERPFDAIDYGAGKYGKLLYPLKSAGAWERANLYNDFYIVPFAGNAATEMTVCVEYDIYDTDVCDEDGKPIPGSFTADHRVRSCKRISTLKFTRPIHFDKNQSRTLNIIINPNYIYSLFDHDEPATMIVE